MSHEINPNLPQENDVHKKCKYSWSLLSGIADVQGSHYNERRVAVPGRTLRHASQHQALDSRQAERKLYKYGGNPATFIRRSEADDKESRKGILIFHLAMELKSSLLILTLAVLAVSG